MLGCRHSSAYRNLLSGGDSPVLVLDLNPKTLAYSGHGPGDFLALLASFGYGLFYPIASYSLHTHDPYMNGIAAKPEHRDRFPALRRWQQQPLSSWDPGILKTLKYFPSCESEGAAWRATPCRNPWSA